jgi:hypothetical protein
MMYRLEYTFVPGFGMATSKMLIISLPEEGGQEDIKFVWDGLYFW